MKATVAEESPYPIPTDTLVPVRLDSIEHVSIPYTIKSGANKGKPATFVKWEWTFSVADGEYLGLSIRGNTEPKLTNQDEPSGSLHLAKPWTEALLGRSLEIGESFDTDDLIGLPAVITVEHMPPRPKKDGSGNWFNVEVDEVFPAAMGAGNGSRPAAASNDPWASVSPEPPF